VFGLCAILALGWPGGSSRDRWAPSDFASPQASLIGGIVEHLPHDTLILAGNAAPTTIQYITLAITALGWIVTAFFQRQLYLLQSKTQKQLADQQERYNRDRELREYLLPERLATLKEIQQWFTDGFAIFQQAPKPPFGPASQERRMDAWRRAIDWGNMLVLLMPWAMFNDPYPPGSSIWTPESGLPSNRMVDLMYALRYIVIRQVNPDPSPPDLPLPTGQLIEEIRIDAFDAVERVRSRILEPLKGQE